MVIYFTDDFVNSPCISSSLESVSKKLKNNEATFIFFEYLQSLVQLKKISFLMFKILCNWVVFDIAGTISSYWNYIKKGKWTYPFGIYVEYTLYSA